MDYRQYLDPEDMTEEEQYERIVQLLALACSRIAKKTKCPSPPNTDAVIGDDLKNGDSALIE